MAALLVETCPKVVELLVKKEGLPAKSIDLAQSISQAKASSHSLYFHLIQTIFATLISEKAKVRNFLLLSKTVE